MLARSGTLQVERWLASRTFHHSAFPPDRLAVERDATVSVCVPAKECAATIAATVAELLGLVEAGAIDEVLVIDADSADGTAEVAARTGARVVSEAALQPHLGPVQGKGDAMWRALGATTGDVVAFVDGDSEGFGAHYACGVVGPVVCEPGAQFCKAFYRRPFRAGEVSAPEGGGRVTELTAKPLLRRFWPQLAGFHQPLAGEMAGRRALFEQVGFARDYGVEIGLLLDVFAAVGLRGMAQTDLDVRHNAHQPLAELGGMADQVLAAVARRLAAEGRLAEA